MVRYRRKLFAPLADNLRFIESPRIANGAKQSPYRITEQNRSEQRNVRLNIREVGNCASYETVARDFALSSIRVRERTIRDQLRHDAPQRCLGNQQFRRIAAGNREVIRVKFQCVILPYKFEGKALRLEWNHFTHQNDKGLFWAVTK